MKNLKSGMNPTKEQVYKRVLEQIASFSLFTMDGRRFNGNHKEALKHINKIVNEALNPKP